MPDPTPFVGQCMRYRIDPGQAAMTTGPEVPHTGQTTNAQVNVGPDPRNPAGTLWSFTFLKFCAGEVTVCPLAGGVLTGPFSGCYTFRYNDPAEKVAHVGTDNTPESPGTLRAKRIWQGMIGGGITGVKGESPSKTIRPDEQFRIAAANQNQLPQLCAYFEGAHAWAVLFIPAVAGVTVINGVLRIAKVTPLALLDWNLVKAMREFR